MMLDWRGMCRVSIWVGTPQLPTPIYARNALTWRPAASVVKTAFLTELFVDHQDALDNPLPGADEILLRPSHTAFSHYSEEEMIEIVEVLHKLTVRELGGVMMRGEGVSETVYNAASNLVIDHFGGLDEITMRIRSQDEELAAVAVRRYMATARKSGYDNEATAAWVGALLCRLARGGVREAEAATLDAIRDVMLESSSPKGNHYYKGGALRSDPICEIRSGWWTGTADPLVYVVMASLTTIGHLDRDAVCSKLKDDVISLTSVILEACRTRA